MTRFLLLSAATVAFLASACGGGGDSPEDVARRAVQAALDGDREALSETFAPGEEINDFGWENWLETFPGGCDVKGAQELDPTASFDALVLVTVVCTDIALECTTFQDEVDGAWRQSLASPLCVREGTRP